MKIKAMRNVHLYLGVFFAPLLFFFLITGCLQVFGLNHGRKDGSRQPPAIIKSLSQVHKNQRWADSTMVPQPSSPLRFLILLMSAGLLATSILGIIMSFQFAPRIAVWVCLLMGTAVPCVLLWLARR
jgi:hypothetical protein